MGSNFNFNNFGNNQPADEAGGGRPPGSFPLTRQPSVYSLTFDEFQSTVGGIGKDLGSMNMDELLKNIWSAEENQIFGSTSGSGGGGQEEGGSLQRQGSLTLPRTLSQKKVDEVWRDMWGAEKDATGGFGGFGIPQRQQTLGEITLEEFLLRAGVVREETQLSDSHNKVGFFGDPSRSVNGMEMGFGYQSQHVGMDAGSVGGRAPESSNQNAIQSANLQLNINGRSAVEQQQQQQQLHQHQQQQQQHILPKPPASAYGAPTGFPSSDHSPHVRGQSFGTSSPMVQNVALQGGGLGMTPLRVNGVGVTTGSPAVSSDAFPKSNGDISSVSPVPYLFNGGLRGRKTPALEKVVERRQRRMIKNRESAARSRARKQAYTTELEEEVAKLKEEHEELRKKQAEMKEMQKNQVLEMMNRQNGAKRLHLRRTCTGP